MAATERDTGDVCALTGSASMRARILNVVLRCVVKRRLSRIQHIDWEIVDSTRDRLARSARAIRVPGSIDVSSHRIEGMHALRLRPRLARRAGVILYLHGGAYAVGDATLYRGLCARLAHAAGADVLALDYALAPERPFPAALDDTVRAWRWLLTEHEAKTLVIAGDSAGGGLALASLLKFRDDGLPLPAAAIALSPWSDLTASGTSLRENAGRDPYLVSRLVEPVAQHYLAGASADTPYASPVFGDYRGLPPITLHVGSTEILLDDTLRVHVRARSAGVKSTLKVWPGLPHVFQLFAPWVPEAEQSLNELGHFARAHIEDPVTAA